MSENNLISDLIPENAVEELIEYSDSGEKKSAYFYLDDEKVAYRSWYGHQICMEYGIKNEKMHGLFRYWHDNGNLCEESFYIDGKEHGITKQYDYEGNLIGSYEMHHGTGVDLWYLAKGIISEERYLKDGNRHGYERWWNEDNKTIYQEQHFQNGIEHGIYRQWNQKGSLCRGFPQYYVNGEKVNKRQYLKACEKQNLMLEADSDKYLPKFQELDNQNYREFPAI
jgi:antitoxin component YwqK of YwqJK toxin-antitoxin module